MKTGEYLALALSKHMITCMKLTSRNNIFCVLEQEHTILSGSEIVDGVLVNSAALAQIVESSLIFTKHQDLPVIVTCQTIPSLTPDKKQGLAMQVGLLVGQAGHHLQGIGPSLDTIAPPPYWSPKQTYIAPWIALTSLGIIAIIGISIYGRHHISTNLHAHQEACQKIRARHVAATKELKKLHLQRSYDQKAQNRKLLPTLLTLIAHQIPDSTYLESVRISPKHLSIDGLSASPKQVQEFASHLALEGQTLKPQIKHITQERGDPRLVRFAIESPLAQLS